MHELFRDFPPDLFALMIAIPVAMATAAIALGWKARQAALHRRAMGEGKGPGEDALAAGITVAVVPMAFAMLMLWARFG